MSKLLSSELRSESMRHAAPEAAQEPPAVQEPQDQEELEARLHMRLLEHTDTNLRRFNVRLERLEDQLGRWDERLRAPAAAASTRRPAAPAARATSAISLVLGVLGGAMAAYVFVNAETFAPPSAATPMPTLEQAMPGQAGAVPPAAAQVRSLTTTPVPSLAPEEPRSGRAEPAPPSAPAPSPSQEAERMAQTGSTQPTAAPPAASPTASDVNAAAPPSETVEANAASRAERVLEPVAEPSPPQAAAPPPRPPAAHATRRVRTRSKPPQQPQPVSLQPAEPEPPRYQVLSPTNGSVSFKRHVDAILPRAGLVCVADRSVVRWLRESAGADGSSLAGRGQPIQGGMVRGRRH